MEDDCAQHRSSARWTRRAFLRQGVASAGALLASGCFRPRTPLARAGAAAVTPLVGAAAAAPLASLRQAISGLVLTPQDADYERYRPAFNRRFDGVYPELLVLPQGTADVQTAVDWARRHGVPLCPRSGGHSYLGNSIGQGMVIDLRPIRQVAFVAGQVDVVDIGGGARLLPVASVLGGRGLALPLGSCPTVGIGGFCLGGGIGLSSRMLGLASDRLEEVEIVLADGRVLRANEQQHADLFWACRGGGGGQLGIVTRLRMRAHRTERVSWFTMGFDWRRAPEVIRYWQKWAWNAPRELTCNLQLFSGPQARCIGQCYGSSDQLAVMVGELARVAHASPALAEGSSAEVSRVWADCEGRSLAECSLPADNPAGRVQRALYEARGVLFGGSLPDDAIAQMIEFIEARAHLPEKGSLILDALGGAVADVPADATAFAHRDVRFVGQIINYGPFQSPAHRGWLADFYAALEPFATGGMYSNYSFAGLDRWQQAIWGQNLPGMLEQKRKWDPDNLFRGEQILTAAPRG
jgi:FAD/FMN-containing dehydrogenase